MAAILFKVEAAVRLGYSASTSNECRWNQLFKDKVYIRVHTYRVGVILNILNPRFNQLEYVKSIFPTSKMPGSINHQLSEEN